MQPQQSSLSQIFKAKLRESLETDHGIQSLVEKFMPSRDTTTDSLEPFLAKPFSLYGNFMALTTKTKESIFGKEMYQYQRVEIEHLHEATRHLRAEYDEAINVMHITKVENDDLVAENNRLRAIIATHKAEM